MSTPEEEVESIAAIDEKVWVARRPFYNFVKAVLARNSFRNRESELTLLLVTEDQWKNRQSGRQTAALENEDRFVHIVRMIFAYKNRDPEQARLFFLNTRSYPGHRQIALRLWENYNLRYQLFGARARDDDIMSMVLQSAF